MILLCAGWAVKTCEEEGQASRLKAQVLERQQGQQQMSQENPCVVDVNVQMLPILAPVTLEQIRSDPFQLKELCRHSGKR